MALFMYTDPAGISPLQQKDRLLPSTDVLSRRSDVIHYRLQHFFRSIFVGVHNRRDGDPLLIDRIRKEFRFNTGHYLREARLLLGTGDMYNG